MNGASVSMPMPMLRMFRKYKWPIYPYWGLDHRSTSDTDLSSLAHQLSPVLTLPDKQEKQSMLPTYKIVHVQIMRII